VEKLETLLVRKNPHEATIITVTVTNLFITHHYQVTINWEYKLLRLMKKKIIAGITRKVILLTSINLLRITLTDGVKNMI
jgi:hypothetical protein